MRKTTAIVQAYLRYARTYERWHKECQHIPIKVQHPSVLYIPGVGFEINDEMHKETAEQIIADLNASARDCIRLIEEKCNPAVPSVYERFVNTEPIYEVQPMEDIADKTLVSV